MVHNWHFPLVNFFSIDVEFSFTLLLSNLGKFEDHFGLADREFCGFEAVVDTLAVVAIEVELIILNVHHIAAAGPFLGLKDRFFFTGELETGLDETRDHFDALALWGILISRAELAREGAREKASAYVHKGPIFQGHVPSMEADFPNMSDGDGVAECCVQPSADY